MGYIKKLKNNELVGGTDKTTIYPVTSAEAVFEEVSDGEFKSQKYLNNNITNERIVDNTIENQKLKDDTIDMGKLNTQLKTIIQNAYDASWKVKEEPFSLETKYDANDVVYDPDTNSSYVSLTADNQGNPVRLEDEEEVNPYWRLVINGISAVQATEEIEATKDELIDYIQENLKDQVDDEIADAESRVAAAEQYAQGVIAEAEETARSISGIVYQTVAATPNYTDTIPVQNKAVTAQIGYYTCSGGSGATIIVDDTDAAAFTPVKGGQVKILMTQKSAVTSGNVQLQFGSATATKKVLVYNEDPVSSSNTWELGEVISVYYDGTKYHASNAQGGSNKKIDAYLYGDLKTLALGQTYTLGESVKTDDKQLLYMLKTVSEMNVTDEVAVNSFKAIKSGTHIGTYQSLKNIKAYTDITYAEGSYAIGSPAGAVIQVTVDSETIAELEESTTISVIIAGIEVSVDVDSTMDAVAVATAIYTAFGTKEEWKLINNNDGTLILISKVAKTTVPTISSNTGSTGITIAFSEASAYAGTNVLSKYSEGSWNTVTLDEFASDSSEVLDTTKVWLKLSFNALKVKLTKQDSVAYETSNTPKNITGGNSDLSICDENGNILVNFKKGEVETKEFNSKYTSIVRNSNSLPSLKICDDKGNVLVIFDNGHIKTKKFDSADIVGNTTLKGKTFSVLGDSISTFSGHVGTSNPFYPKDDVNSDGKTWWGRLKADSGLIDYRINAIGASTISRHLTSQIPISDSSRFSQLFSEGGSGNVPNFIIVFGGINDWNSGATLGSYTDDFSSPTTTFIPSVRYLMKQLQLTYPASTIFFCTPVRSWFGSLSTYYPPTKGGRSLEDYVNAIIKCGSLHGVPIIDLYNNLNINEGNMTNMLIDKLHPKYAGNIAIATYIRHELEKYV